MRKVLLFLLPLVLSSAACAVMQPLPTSPHLEGLTAQSAFAGAPPAEWPTVSPENPTTAPVDVACGVGPRTATGSVYAAVTVTGRTVTSAVPPLSVSLVLDRSGSMSGKPFDNMLRAAEAFVNAFRDGDRLSVVVFSDGVYEAIPPIEITPATRSDAIKRVRALQDGGGTWLSGGLLGGYFEIFSHFVEWQVSQVVLLSDGQPNTGITDSTQLFSIAARAAEHGVGTTTIGFGPLHDELLMQGIADAGGGTYYYVGEAGDIPAIFQKEANAILRTAVRGTWAVMAIPPGVEIEDVIGWDYFIVANRLYIFVGGVPYQEQRFAVIRMKPSRPIVGSLPIQVSYADVTRRGKFGINCAPVVGPNGGNDAWVIEAAGHAEAAWGLAEAMGWADADSEVYAISQISYTRDLIKALMPLAPAGSLADEDALLAGAQATLGIGVATEASNSITSGGLGGLMNFGAKTVERTATAAVVDSIDKKFQAALRRGMPFTLYGIAGVRYSARGQRVFRMHEGNKNAKYKKARFDAYLMMRVRLR